MTQRDDDASPEATARRYWGEALPRKEPGASERAYAPGATCQLPGEATPRTAREMTAYFQELYDALPDLRFELVDLLSQDDRVAVRWKVTGTFRGPGKLAGLAPNGRPISIEGADFARVVDGLLTDLISYSDTGAAGRQLGVLPPPGSFTERAAVGAANAGTRLRQVLGHDHPREGER